MKSGNGTEKFLSWSGAMLRCISLDFTRFLLNSVTRVLGAPFAAAAERASHALDAEGDAAVAGADGDRLRDAVQRLHAGAALAVRVEGADLGREAGEARDVVRADEDQLAGAHDVAEADVLDEPGADLGVALHQGAYDGGGRFIEAGGDELAAAAASEGGAGAIDEDYVLLLHVSSSGIAPSAAPGPGGECDRSEAGCEKRGAADGTG